MRIGENCFQTFSISKSSGIFYLCMIHIAEVVQSSTLSNAILVLLAYFKMATAANDSLVELAHDLQCVSEVAGSFGLTEPVTHRPCQREVMLVILHRFNIVSHVEIGVAKLTIDG